MANVYEIVTDAIIKQMEQGIVPWNKPWHATGEEAISRSTGKPYRGINRMLLPYGGEYATFKQITDAKGKVNKGEHGFPVVFWKQTKVVDKDPTTGEEVTKVIPVLRYYTVFHIENQTDLEPKHEAPEPVIHDPIETAEQYIESYVSASLLKLVRHKASNRAYYSPLTDTVVVPMMSQFDEVEEFYSTIFHELTHSTGHESRLNRLGKVAKFGDESYSKEELVAEMGSAMLMHICGISTDKVFKNSVAYLQGWSKALRDDSRLMVSASSRAEKAVKFILGEEMVAEV